MIMLNLLTIFSLAHAPALAQTVSELQPPTPSPVLPSAKAELVSKSGSSVKGRVSFAPASRGGLRVSYKVEGLAKNSTYGFHIHENGNCTSEDGKSAGGHYVQVEATGGTSQDNPARYAGDLLPLKSDAKGVAQGTFTMKNLSINQANAVQGRSVIVHGGPDNLNEKSAPRIACGLIVADAQPDEVKDVKK